MLKMVLATIGIIATMAAAQGNDGDTRIIAVGGTSIEVILVKAGSYVMGDTRGVPFPDGWVWWSPETENVTIAEDFWISKYPITQAQYQAVTGNNPSHFSGKPNNPVENVTWSEAVAFATAVGGRLPTQEEWEWAARGGNKTKNYLYSGSDDLNEVAWWSGNSGSQTQPVGQKLPNELGIYDMSGNVWEWTATEVLGSPRVIRGGRWHDDAVIFRVANRGNFSPNGRSNGLGIRVAFNSVTITFNSNGGTAIPAINTPHNTTITAPTDPTRENFRFVFWSSDENNEIQWDFRNPITQNITLYAVWQHSEHFGRDRIIRSDTDYLYTGEPIKLGTIKLLTVNGWSILHEGVDFDARYDNNVRANGNARAEITGRGVFNREGITGGTITFTIKPRTIKVKWENEGPFTYNRTEQVPRPIADIDFDNEVIRMLTLRPDRNPWLVGTHTVYAEIPRNTVFDGNVHLDLETYRITYEIEPRELKFVMRDENRNVVNRIGRETNETIRDTAALFAFIENFLGFDGFATGTMEGKTDNDSVLTGRPRFEIQNDNSQHSLRSLPVGRFIVNVIGDEITSQNYTILERQLSITITERFITLENYPSDNPVSISDVKKSDSRYGIRFAINPTSDKAEISVILPNNERAVETNIVIYDMTGNVVFVGAGSARPTIWDLRNSAGRIVANGTYLVIAEAKDRNGKMYQYSARLGVKR